MPVVFLLTAIVLSGIQGAALKPADTRCRNSSELQLFNGCFNFVAALAAMVVALMQGSIYMPAAHLPAAAIFGLGFSLTIYFNLKSLHNGPVSITTLIMNFSLIMPLSYSFIWLGEDITIFRVIGILLIVVCMIIFTNPKLSGGEKISGKWIASTLLAMLFNGCISLIQKIYALETENVYSAPYLMYCYLFATLFSVIICAFSNIGKTGDDRINLRRFFNLPMCGIALLCGLSNGMMNYMVLLLATLMDGAIVYPAVQGGGPIITTIISMVIFKEKLTWKQAAAIVMGVAAIVLLNL